MRSQFVTTLGKNMNEIITLDILQQKIFTIRNQRVMIDRDLAELYGVELKKLNQAVKRNLKRFPADFMFQLTDIEWENLRSQFVTANPTVAKVRFLPYAFTEHGVTMLASVLNSENAIEINVQVVRAFIQLRQIALENKDLSKRVTELEHYFIEHCKDYKEDMKDIHRAIDLLMDRTKPAKVGFIKTED